MKDRINHIILIFLIEDYLLDKITENRQIRMLPNPYRYIRNKIIENKIMHSLNSDENDEVKE